MTKQIRTKVSNESSTFKRSNHESALKPNIAQTNQKTVTSNIEVKVLERKQIREKRDEHCSKTRNYGGDKESVKNLRKFYKHQGMSHLLKILNKVKFGGSFLPRY